MNGARGRRTGIGRGIGRRPGIVEYMFFFYDIFFF